MSMSATTRKAEQSGTTPHVVGFLYAGIWIVFLAVPLIAAWFSDAATEWRVLAAAATVVFAGAYLWFAWRFFSVWTHTSTRQIVIGCLVLACVAALSLPGIGPWVSAYTPYIAALVVYTRPPHIGIPVGILIWAVPSVSAFLLADDRVLWILGGPGIGMAFTVVFRVVDYYEERDRAREQEVRQAEERGRMARDVHDVLGHSLTVLHLKAQVARRYMDADPHRARAELEEIERMAREGLTQVRSTVTRLRAPQLPQELDIARTALEAAGVEAMITAADDVDPAPGSVLAWGLREAVTNVVRHSEARSCEITLSRDRLRVADDGRGADGSAEGNGLTGLRERAVRAGAQVSVGRAYPDMQGTSSDRPGTRVEVTA